MPSARIWEDANRPFSPRDPPIVSSHQGYMCLFTCRGDSESKTCTTSSRQTAETQDSFTPAISKRSSTLQAKPAQLLFCTTPLRLRQSVVHSRSPNSAHMRHGTITRQKDHTNQSGTTPKKFRIHGFDEFTDSKGCRACRACKIHQRRPRHHLCVCKCHSQVCQTLPPHPKHEQPRKNSEFRIRRHAEHITHAAGQCQTTAPRHFSTLKMQEHRVMQSAAATASTKNIGRSAHSVEDQHTLCCSR